MLDRLLVDSVVEDLCCTDCQSYLDLEGEGGRGGEGGGREGRPRGGKEVEGRGERGEGREKGRGSIACASLCSA